MYGAYLPKYNQRIIIQSSFTIDIEGSNDGMVDYELNVTLNKVATTSATNMVMHMILTESDIQQSWQGMTELNHVERVMVPNQNGTPLDFSTSNTIQITKNFTMDPAWNNENCEVIVFIQNLQNKEILQATLRNLMDFVTTNSIDASIVKVVAPLTICQDHFIPKVVIKNFGLDNLTSLDIVTQMNNEPSITTNWTGNLALLESEFFELPEFSFTAQTSNTFTVTCENPNGQSDQFPSNNTKSITSADAPNVTSPVTLALKLDGNPGETTWTLLNSDGITMYSGGPYTQPNQFIIQNFELNDIDCYTYIIYDSGGDGLTGNGGYKLAHNGSTIFYQGKDIGFEEQVQFGIGLTDIEEIDIDIDFCITPNPINQQASVTFNLAENNLVQLKVFNSVGSLVFETKEQIYQVGNHTILFENNNLNNGIYYFQLASGSKTLSRKVVITK
jgi:hypothetical protein